MTFRLYNEISELCSTVYDFSGNMKYVVNWKVRENLKETENGNELLSSKVGKFLSRVCYVEIVSMIFSQCWIHAWR